jgi:hypothetical protein
MATTSVRQVKYQLLPSQPQEKGCCSAIILYGKNLNSFVALEHKDFDTQL